MDIVKQGMGHGDLSLESFTQVWEECLSQVNAPKNIDSIRRLVCPVLSLLYSQTDQVYLI